MPAYAHSPRLAFASHLWLCKCVRYGSTRCERSRLKLGDQSSRSLQLVPCSLLVVTRSNRWRIPRRTSSSFGPFHRRNRAGGVGFVGCSASGCKRSPGIGTFSAFNILSVFSNSSESVFHCVKSVSSLIRFIIALLRSGEAVFKPPRISSRQKNQFCAAFCILCNGSTNRNASIPW